MPHALFFSLLITLSYSVDSFKILAIISLPLKSHFMAIKPLFQELANKGHSVTVINNFPDEDPVQNLVYINLPFVKSPASSFKTLQFYENFDSDYLRIYNVYRHFAPFISESVKSDCDNLFSYQIRDHVSKVEYDVVFVEQFLSDCALAFAGVMTDAPIIGISSHVLLPWSYSRLGLPFDVGSDAFYFSVAGPNPSLYHKVEAFVIHHFMNTIGLSIIQKGLYESFENHLPDYKLDVEKIARERMKMMFSYQNFALTGARLLAPQLLEIGGLHVGKPKPLPEDLQKFLNSATHGAVFISFGSNMKSSSMSETRMKEFMQAFQKISPMKVLMKWENSSVSDDHFLMRSWFPQLDVLCHPRVVGFVSHGGMLSASESASCGVPMVVIPFFGDQFTNAASIRAAGMGTVLTFDRVRADTLADAIKEVTDEKVQKRGKEISVMWHDRPTSTMDSAIFWTEFVARHTTAFPSLPSKNSTWYERLLLDVVSVIFLFFVTLVTVFFLICKMLMFLIRSFVVLCNKNKLKRA